MNESKTEDCKCLETVREKLNAHHGENSAIQLELKTVMKMDASGAPSRIMPALPPLYYSYLEGKKRKKSYVTFSFCPFCGKKA